jgi:tetratricopeptide (TPR) repeat protein
MLVTLPFVFLLLDFWPLSRSDGWLRLVGEKLPLFVLSALSSIVTVVAQRAGEAVVPVEELGLATRLANAVVSYWTYIGQMFWPTGLSCLYPFEAALPIGQLAAATAGLVVVTAAALMLRRRAPYAAVGWLWYVGTLVPVIGIVQVGAQAHADRYTYLPLVGLFILITWSILDLAKRSRWVRVLVVPGAIIVVVACGLAARQETVWWKNTETLFRRAVEVTRDNKFARYYLAKELAGQGRDQEALAHYEEAVRLMPENVNLHFNYGNALRRLRRFDEAARQYDEAARRAPDDAEIRFAAGTASALAGRNEVALGHFLHVVRLEPDHAEAHFRAAVITAQLGDTEAALQRLRIALRLDPDSPQATEMLRYLERKSDGAPTD